MPSTGMIKMKRGFFVARTGCGMDRFPLPGRLLWVRPTCYSRMAAVRPAHDGLCFNARGNERAHPRGRPGITEQISRRARAVSKILAFIRGNFSTIRFC